jgi:hypothetical protein
MLTRLPERGQRRGPGSGASVWMPKLAGHHPARRQHDSVGNPSMRGQLRATGRGGDIAATHARPGQLHRPGPALVHRPLVIGPPSSGRESIPRPVTVPPSAWPYRPTTRPPNRSVRLLCGYPGSAPGYSPYPPARIDRPVIRIAPAPLTRRPPWWALARRVGPPIHTEPEHHPRGLDPARRFDGTSATSAQVHATSTGAGRSGRKRSPSSPATLVTAAL